MVISRTVFVGVSVGVSFKLSRVFVRIDETGHQKYTFVIMNCGLAYGMNMKRSKIMEFVFLLGKLKVCALKCVYEPCRLITSVHFMKQSPPVVGLFSGHARQAGTRKMERFWILTRQDMAGVGASAGPYTNNRLG